MVANILHNQGYYTLLKLLFYLKFFKRLIKGSPYWNGHSTFQSTPGFVDEKIGL
jgi:hypothetical protein